MQGAEVAQLRKVDGDIKQDLGRTRLRDIRTLWEAFASAEFPHFFLYIRIQSLTLILFSNTIQHFLASDSPLSLMTKCKDDILAEIPLA